MDDDGKEGKRMMPREDDHPWGSIERIGRNNGKARGSFSCLFNGN
jgi:hypothetical protein